MGIPGHLKESERIIAAHGDDIEKYANELTGRQVYCIPVDTELSDVPGRVMLYFDPWNRLNLCNELSNHINRLSAELAALKRYPKNKLGRYTPYFVITKHENDSGFDYKVDAGKVDMDGDRIRTHNEQTTEGKTFVVFIACVIRSYLLNKLRQYLTDNSTSMKKVFSQFSNIAVISGHNGYHFTVEISLRSKVLAIPLSQIKPSDIDDDTVEAICDWHYWKKQGYTF